MSPRAARAAALPFAFLAFALRMLDTFWFEPLTWRVASDAVGFLLWTVGMAVSAGLPLAAYLLITRGARRRPAAFDIDAVRQRFIAPATPRWFGPWSVLVGWLMGDLIVTERVPHEDRMRLADRPYLNAVAVVLAIAGLVVITIVALRQRPFLSLSRAGITDQRWVRDITIGWDQLVPGGPPPPVTRDPRALTIHTWTASTAGSFTPHELPARDWHVDPAFLAHTIRTYAEHSRVRAAIGTASELARLQATFTPDTASPTATQG